MLQIELGNPAKRFLKKCDTELYERIIDRIKKLGIDSFPPDVKRVAGRKEKVFRVRVGNYRITYIVDHKANLLLITDVDKRDKVYD